MESRLVMFGQLVLGIDERRPYLAPGQVSFRFLTASRKRKIEFALDEIRLGKHDALLNYACIDSFSVLHDRELVGQLYGYDPDGDAITAQLVSGPTNGTLTFHPDGTFTYTPNTNYIGADSFTYTWSDGLTSGSTATVTIDVYNNASYAYDASFSVLHDHELTAYYRWRSAQLGATQSFSVLHDRELTGSAYGYDAKCRHYHRATAFKSQRFLGVINLWPDEWHGGIE
jgi:hypothetical protein